MKKYILASISYSKSYSRLSQISISYVSLRASIPPFSLSAMTTSWLTDINLSESFFPVFEVVRSLNAKNRKTFMAKVEFEYFRKCTTSFSTFRRRWESPKHILQCTYINGKMIGRKIPRNIINGSLQDTKIEYN